MEIKKKAENIINEIIDKLKSEYENLEISSITEKPYNYEVEITDYPDKNKLLIYFGKKGIRKVIQGTKSSAVYNILNEEKDKKPVIDETQLLPYIGSDESGKGDFFGPLVIGSVFIDENSFPKLAKLNLRDSKDLSKYQIFSMANEIKKVLKKENYEIYSIEPELYNKAYSKYKNLNTLLTRSHNYVLEKMISSNNCKKIILDKFSEQKLQIEKDSSLKVIKENKAEKYLAVAAASILARDELNKWFEENKIDGLPLHKGASNEVLEQAKYILQCFGKEIFTKISKLHFKTFKKITIL